MHLDEARLQEYLDEELSEVEVAVADRHLRACVACRAELMRMESLATGFATAIAVVQPKIRAGIYAPADTRRPPRLETLRRSLPRAAVFLVGVAAAASATVPGSPVRDWFERAIAPAALVEAPAPAPSAAPPAAAPAPAPLVEAGVSVDPLDGTVRVALRGAADELLVRAEVVEGPRAGVYAAGEAADARFRTAPGQIDVEEIGGGELRIELPRAARSATVTVNGREYLRKELDELRLAVPAAGRSATAVTFRVKQ